MQPSPKNIQPRWIARVLFALFAASPAAAQFPSEWELGARYTPSGVTKLELPTDIAMSGRWAVVGSPEHMRSDGEKYGAAWVFDVITGRELFILSPPGLAPKDAFGEAVAIGGGLIVVGAPGDDEKKKNAGAVYLFDSATGTLRAKLFAPGGQKWDRFGSSLAIDGEQLIVGAPYGDTLVKNSGAAYLFSPVSLGLGKLLLPSSVKLGDRIGSSVDISGSRAVVGAFFSASQKYNRGTAFLFDTTSGLEIAELKITDLWTTEGFGYSVAIDGAHVLVGAPWSGPVGPGSGAAFVYDAENGHFKTALIGSQQDLYDVFGTSVALRDGVAVIGAPNTLLKGGTYAFDSQSWTETGLLIPEPLDWGDHPGGALATSGGLVASLARRADGSPANAGAVQVWAHVPITRYCAPDGPNSIGKLGTLYASGMSVSQCSVQAGGLPVGAPALLLIGNGSLAGPGPPGSTGDLCLGGSVPGYGTYAADLKPADFLGLATVDLISGATGAGTGQLPPPIGGSLQAGQTWNFQAWYRDGATSRFTDAITLTFLP
jgi:FG-GAP repeat